MPAFLHLNSDVPPGKDYNCIMGSRREGPGRQAAVAAWRTFALRDWHAIESETRRARAVAYRKGGPETHHALYLELSEGVLERRMGGGEPCRDPSDMREDAATHQAVQEALRRLAGR